VVAKSTLVRLLYLIPALDSYLVAEGHVNKRYSKISTNARNKMYPYETNVGS
jgi:hypothetical protein